MEEGEEIIKEVKKVIFLSADDFKEKSIQVIRKTPEAYVAAGWEVYYIVLRDSSNKGNYFYEEPIDIPGAHVLRKEVPGTRLLNSIKNPVLSSILIRLRRYLAMYYLAKTGIHYSRNIDFDVLYGYEQPGAVAAKFIKSLGFFKNARLVLRFQGVVFVKEWLNRNLWYRKITNFEIFYALRGPSDLCIMTNDGSQGDSVLQRLNSRHKKIAFLSNGVDRFRIDAATRLDLLYKYKSNNEYLFVSISRLDDHKRVDRCIRFVKKVVESRPDMNFRYLIIGEGAKRTEFENLVRELNLDSSVEFIGAIRQSEVPSYLDIGDAFLSMYESSNVGNPLLEAIRLNKFIVTLENGGTGEWITHKRTGLIFPVDDEKDLSDSDFEHMKNTFLEVIEHSTMMTLIRENLKEVERRKLWSWEDRFAMELNLVNQLL